MKCFRFSALCSLSFLLIATPGCTPKPKAPILKNAVAVARIDDVAISDEDVLSRIVSIEKTFPKIYSTHPQKKRLLEEMISVELLYEEALKQGYDKKFEFKTKLADLYAQGLAERAREKITDEVVTRYFEDNRDAFEQVSARHILLKFSPNLSAKEKAALKSRIEAYRAELLQNPDKFQGYAAQYSEDSTRTNNGELGFFHRSTMVSPFSRAAFDLKKVGDISAVVETQYGYHLIQLSGEKRKLDDYRDQIRDHLLRTSQRERLDQEVSRLRKDRKIEIFEENLVKLSPLPAEILTPPEKLIPKDFKPTVTPPAAPPAAPPVARPAAPPSRK